MQLVTQEPPRLHHAPKTPKSCTASNKTEMEWFVQERLAAVEKSSEEVGQQHRKEMSRLEAALTGAEAAKKQLGAQQAQHSTAGESDLQAANAAQAEADARASSLQRQIDTLRAQAAASRSGLQDEANSLKVLSLPQPTSPPNPPPTYTMLLCSVNGTECTNHRFVAA